VLFSSYIFLFAFLPATLLVYWLLRGSAARLAFLALASYVFYAYWDWRYVPLMIAATSIDWIAGGMIARSDERRRRKLLLTAAITLNVAILGYFKYRGFFLDSLNGLSALLGGGRPFPALRVVLPLGISFYTFSAIAYVVDVYRGTCAPAKNLIHYSAFIAMFPRVTAGPIVRYTDIDDQFANMEPRFTANLAATGLYFFACGLAKKLLVADVLLPHVDNLFATSGSLGFFSSWAAALGYTLQLYFDFSGYSDMAVGAAFFLGFRLPQNFDSPYKATNASQFWRRWHMTLSFWLRDYIFIPLGGSWGTLKMTVRNLMITFLIGGLWHGAGWTFVIWGGLWGFYQSAHLVARRYKLTPSWAWLNRAITFVCVVVAWVFFRAPSVKVAGGILKAMVGLHGFESAHRLSALVGVNFALMIFAGLLWVNFAPNTWEIKLQPRLRYAVVLGLLLGAAILMMSNPSPFLYFQF
jgi:alginate O-acetyltransferase complex protein AlgI